MSSRIEQMKLVQQESLDLFKKKNQDYGDAFANYGAIGVLVRMGDKISRLQTITNRNVSLINTESLRDTLIDLHNYSAMTIMLLDEDKDKKDNLVNNLSNNLSNKKLTTPTPVNSPPFERSNK